MKIFSALLIVFIGLFNGAAADIDFAPAPGSPLKLAGGGCNFVMGDVNRDGKPDLIVCSSNALAVLLGNGRRHRGGARLLTSRIQTISRSPSLRGPAR